MCRLEATMHGAGGHLLVQTFVPVLQGHVGVCRVDVEGGISGRKTNADTLSTILCRLGGVKAPKYPEWGRREEGSGRHLLARPLELGAPIPHSVVALLLRQPCPRHEKAQQPQPPLWYNLELSHSDQPQNQ